MIELVLSIVLTSVLTSLLTFLSLRFLFKGISEALLANTKLGASAMGIKSGISRGTKAAMEDISTDFLQSPKMAGLKMVADQFGFDIDGMIEEHGAVETLAGINQILGLIGIDLQTVMNKGLGDLTKGFLGTANQSSSGKLP